MRNQISIFIAFVFALLAIPTGIFVTSHGGDSIHLLTVESAQGQSQSIRSFVIVITKEGFNGSHSSNLHIKANQGDLVSITFVMDEEQRADTNPRNRHIMEVSGYDLQTEEISPSNPQATLTFLASKPGTFKIMCSSITYFCPQHNALQDGVLEVTPEVETLTTTSTVSTTSVTTTTSASTGTETSVTATVTTTSIVEVSNNGPETGVSPEITVIVALGMIVAGFVSGLIVAVRLLAPSR